MSGTRLSGSLGGAFFCSEIMSGYKFSEKKFPTLCELCDMPGKCLYSDEFEGSHIAAMKCLEQGRGEVAYVALDYVKEYFGVSIVACGSF